MVNALITFIDSTPLRACRQQRIHCHKVFKGIATRGQCSLGWFFGFKLNIICNDKGELLNFVFTPANTDDREPLSYKNFMKDVNGKLIGDKGYISKKLFEQLFVNGIQLVTKIKKNMKNCLMASIDKILLRKRAVIETINDELKIFVKSNIQDIDLSLILSPIYFLGLLYTASYLKNHL